MMNSFDKEQFSRDELAPANARSTTITFIMMSVLGENTKNQEKLTQAWPYLRHGEMIASNNGSFHEYDINLAYALDVRYVTDLDFDIEDENLDDDELDSNYLTSRFNARDRKEPEWGAEKNDAVVYFLPNEEYEYFVTMDGWKDWYFIASEREDYSHYHRPTQVTSLKQLKNLMDTEMIHAIKNWEASREGGGW